MPAPDHERQPMSSKPPTSKQLAYLRALAERTGQTFAMPRTRQDASAEIRTLKATPAESRLERRIERDEIADAIGTGFAGQRAGHRGRSHRVRLICDLEATVMTTRAVTGNHRNSDYVGERMELGRYRTAAGVERMLYGQRIATVVRVTDVPAEPPGRAYLVERGLAEDGYAALLALVADYLETANQLGVPPMSTTVLG
jgi:hypothetical protein